MRKVVGMLWLIGLVALVACSGVSEPGVADGVDGADSQDGVSTEVALQPVEGDGDASAETTPDGTRPDQLGAPSEPDTETRDDMDETEIAPDDKPETTAVAPVEVDLSEITPSAPDPNATPQVMPEPGRPGDVRVPAALEPLVAAVTASLATERAVDEAAIAVTGIKEVTWNDGSLGCPEEGMMYTQALVDGYNITMTVDGKPVEVHTSGSTFYVVCENGAPVSSGSVTAPGADPADS